MIDPKTITHIKTFHDSFDGNFEIKTQPNCINQNLIYHGIKLQNWQFIQRFRCFGQLPSLRLKWSMYGQWTLDIQQMAHKWVSVSDSDELMTRSARFSESPTPIFSWHVEMLGVTELTECQCWCSPEYR